MYDSTISSVLCIEEGIYKFVMYDGRYIFSNIILKYINKK